MLKDIQMTKEGLFIPHDTYQSFGEIDIVLDKDYILIKPKNVTLQYSGFIRPTLKIEELEEDYELSLLAGEA
jgi:hypothetical protein